MAVLPGEDDHGGQAADDDADDDQQCGAHGPVERHHAGSRVLAHLAALRALEALERPGLLVDGLLSLTTSS